MIKRLSFLAALNLTLLAPTAQADIVFNIPAALKGADFCSQLAGDWNGSAKVLGCTYEGTGTVTNYGNGQFALDGMMYGKSGFCIYPQEPLNLKGSCDSDHIVINEGDANLKGDLTLENQTLTANLSGTIHIDNIGDIPVNNMKFAKQ